MMKHECVSDEQVASDVKQYGLSVMLIKEGENCPKFAYSVGLYHNFNHPEIIVFGLEHEIAGWVINEIGRRVKAGNHYEPGRKCRGLLEGYSCMFRQVPKGCYPEYFGYAMGFYKSGDFPVLQLVWPDKQRRWPWDDDFNPAWIWQQPLLENWPEEKMKSNWVFNKPRNPGVFTTRRVMEEGLPILDVFHNENGDWQFLCGTTTDVEQACLVCLNDIVQLDSTVNGIADLPRGWQAWRSKPGEEWRREPEQE
jgi:hypothetical protein